MRSGFESLAWTLICAYSQGRPKLLAISSVAAWCNAHGKNRLPIYPEREFTLKPVSLLGAQVRAINHNQKTGIKFPSVGIVVLENATLVGSSEMLIMDNALLYDELALGNPNRYGCKAWGTIPCQMYGRHLPAVFQNRVLVAKLTKGRDIDRGIHLCKDHSSNYYHWLFECLPRAIIALQLPEFSGYPLLVDALLPKQSMSALLAIAGTREIIAIEQRASHKVGELVFPDVLSYSHDNYGDTDVADMLIAPEAVALLRNSYSVAQSQAVRKLYVARDGANYRRMRNEVQIQAYLVEQGFEIIRPEQLSFAEQVECFSQAEIIIGPTGAGMSNMLFAPRGCKIIVLAGATNNANHYIFGQLGQWLDHDLCYVMGRAHEPQVLHSDYTIELLHLQAAMPVKEPQV